MEFSNTNICSSGALNDSVNQWLLKIIFLKIHKNRYTYANDKSQFCMQLFTLYNHMVLKSPNRKLVDIQPDAMLSCLTSHKFNYCSTCLNRVFGIGMKLWNTVIWTHTRTT